MVSGQAEQGPARKAPFWPVPLVLLIICFSMFADVILGIRHGILSDAYTDLATEFYYWRDFGFSELRHGHLAQWNPYVYGGVPFFAGWQAGLLYPPNWLYLFIPLVKAITLDAVVSTYIMGVNMSLLARKFGFHPLACLLAGIIGMFNGAFFPHIYAGHLATIASMAWAPLMLMALDSIIDRPNLRSVLIGSFAFAMQILAGHPQTIYNTIVMLIIYTAIRLIKSPLRVKALATLSAMAASGILLTAVQLLTGLQVNVEGTRSGAVPFGFASEFSFPPENFLTLITPELFGDIAHVQYWGRWYLWETCAFVSVAALPLIFIGIATGNTARRRLWVTMIAIFCFIALGRYTGVYYYLFEYIPGLSKFRSPAKFIFEVCIFLTLLAAAGLDSLIRIAAREGDRQFRVVLAAVSGMALLGLGAAVASIVAISPIGMHLIVKLVMFGSSLSRPDTEDTAGFLRHAQLFAAKGLSMTALMSFLIGAALILALRKPRRADVLVAIACVELFLFGRTMVTTFDPSVSKPPMMTAWYRSYPGDYRVIQNDFLSNTTMAYRKFDVWGYDPMVLRRYSEFVIAAERGDPNEAGEYAILRHPAQAFRMLRLKYMFNGTQDQPNVSVVDGPLEHAQMIYQYRIVRGRDRIFKVILDDHYPATKEVVLEGEPGVAAAPPATPGFASAHWVDSDTLDVVARTSTPGIVLITDTYSRFFHAAGLTDSSQKSYRVLPANYMEMGVPVCAGYHHFRINYCPPAFRAGAWISGAALAAFVWLAIVAWRPRSGDAGGGALSAETAQAPENGAAPPASPVSPRSA